MLAIVIALKNELFDWDNFKIFFNLVKINNFDFYINKNKKIILCFSGVGKANASSYVSVLITNWKIKNLINIGFVGSINNINKINSIAIVNKFIYLDVDATNFNYELGQVPREEKFYISNKTLNEKISNLFGKENIQYEYLNLGTSDSFINIKNIDSFNKELLNIVNIFDMEATSIAQVCFKNNINFSSVKVISDSIKIKQSSNEQFYNNLINCSKNILNILNILMKSNL